MRDGYCDAITKLGIQSIKEGPEIKSKIGKLEEKNLEQLEQQVQQIEKSVRVRNSHDLMILDQTEDLAHKAQSILDHHNGSIEEEKAILINAAIQFKEILIQTKNLRAFMGRLSSPFPRNIGTSGLLNQNQDYSPSGEFSGELNIMTRSARSNQSRKMLL